MIIERTDEEYVQEIEDIYNEQIKPRLNEGMSLTRALKSIGKGTSGKSRWYREMRQLAFDDGYQSRCCNPTYKK